MVPTIQPLVKIADDNVLLHSPEFVRADASEKGLKTMLDAAKAMAMTVIDLLANHDILKEARQELDAGK